MIVGAFDEDGDGALPPNDALPDAGAVYLFVPADAADGADRDVGGAWREHVYAK